ncbi:MAG: Spo0B domain-containing protein [Bacillota bacterium]
MDGDDLILKELLELIRLQKHDFLNHFQVVMGFLQLNRPERALQYVKETLGVLDESWGIMSNIQQSWLAALMMPKVYKALGMRVRVSIDIEAWPEKQGDDRGKYQLVISEVWKALLSFWEQIEIDQRAINISISRNEETDYLVFDLPLPERDQPQPGIYLDPVITWAERLPVDIDLSSDTKCLYIKIELFNT